MMLDDALANAQQLVNEGRYEAALSEYERLAEQAPENASVQAGLGYCYLMTKNYLLAEEACLKAVRLNPENAHSHYVYGRAMLALKHPERAVEAFLFAINIDKTKPDYYSQLAVAYSDCRQYSEALGAAAQGLEIDPENVGLHNLKKFAERRLQEVSAENGQTIVFDENDPEAQAVLGHILLRAKHYKEAREAFGRALTLNPNCEPARVGMIEALKSKNFLYRALMQYFFWLESLGSAAMLVVFGLWALNRFFLSEIPVLNSLYIIFALTTWVGPTLFNALLVFDKNAKKLLKKREINFAYITAAVAIFGLIFYGLGVGFKANLFTLWALVCGLSLIPISRLAMAEPGIQGNWLTNTAAYILLALGAGCFGVWFVAPGIGETVMMAFIYGTVAFSFAYNILNSIRIG